MKKLNLEKDYLFFGVDELEFTVNDIQKDVFILDEDTNVPPVWTLDFDNTSQANITFFGYDWNYSKIKPRGYSDGLKFQLVIDNKIIDCFALLKGKTNKACTSKDKVVFYSSFFVLEHLGKLSFSLYDFMICFTDDIHINRLDIALDLPYSIKDVKTKIFKGVNFFSQIGIDSEFPQFSETYYINNPRSDRNRKYIFRIYDKVKDTWLKKKGFLYPHLNKNKKVRRIELELRAEECKRLSFGVYNVLQNNISCIQKIYSNYFNKHSVFYPLKYDKLELTKYENNSFDLKGYYLNHGHIPHDYLSRSHGYLKNIKEGTGYNGLFDVIFKIEKDDKGNFINRNIYNTLDFLEHLIKYIKNQGIHKSLIRKVLKNKI